MSSCARSTCTRASAPRASGPCRGGRSCPPPAGDDELVPASTTILQPGCHGHGFISYYSISISISLVLAFVFTLGVDFLGMPGCRISVGVLFF